MLDDAADIIQAVLRQIAIFVASKERVAVFPDRLVTVHARTVIAINRLRHEGRAFAIGMGDIMHDIFIELQIVGNICQRVEFQTQFVLGSGHFVVVLFNIEAHFFHHGEHFATQVLAAIDRIDREIAALGARAVAHIASFIFGAGIVGQFRAVQREAGIIGVGRKPHIVKYKKLGFGAKINRVANAGRLQIFLSAQSC